MARMARRYRTAYNTLDRPVVIDDDGRTIAGGEFGPARAGHDLVVGAVDRGELTFLPDGLDPDADGVELADQAAAAVRATRVLNDADADNVGDAALAGMTARELVDHLADHPDAVDMVAAVEADRPEPRSTVLAAIDRIRTSQEAPPA